MIRADDIPVAHTRPIGLPLDIEVTRRRVGGRMVWTYLGFTATLERVDATATEGDHR